MAETTRRTWTAKELQYLRDHYPAQGAIPCAAALGISDPRVVAARANRLGLTSGRFWAWTPDQDATLRRVYPRGGRKAAAREVGCSRLQAKARARVLGLRYRGRLDARQAGQLYRAGYCDTHAGRWLEVSDKSVSRWRARNELPKNRAKSACPGCRMGRLSAELRAG
jgi:hypothetical protein